MIDEVLKNKPFAANLVFFLIILGIFADMLFPGARSSLDTGAPSRGLCHIIQMAILGVMGIYVFRNYTLPQIRAVQIWEMSLYAFLVLTLVYAAISFDPEQAIVVAKMVSWPIAYFFFRLLGDAVPGYRKKWLYLVVTMCVFAVWFYIQGAEFRARFAANSVVVGSNVAWDLLYIYLLSLCLLGEGDRKGYFIAMVALFMVPATLKRGAILAQLAICISLLSAGYRLGVLSSFLRKGIAFCFIAFLGWSVAFAGHMGGVATRFSGVTSDGGSGRAEFYQLLYDRWRDADLWEWLFGFGFWSTPEYLGRVWINNVYAHSDILEVLHDYGLLGLLMYGMILLGGFLICRHTWRERSWGMFIAFSVFSLFLVKGALSGNIMFRQTMYVVMPLGYMVGHLEQAHATAEDTVPVGLAYSPC